MTRTNHQASIIWLAAVGRRAEVCAIEETTVVGEALTSNRMWPSRMQRNSSRRSSSTYILLSLYGSLPISITIVRCDGKLRSDFARRVSSVSIELLLVFCPSPPKLSILRVSLEAPSGLCAVHNRFFLWAACATIPLCRLSSAFRPSACRRELLRSRRTSSANEHWRWPHTATV